MAARPTALERAADRLPIIVLLDNVRSAHNVGLVFRLCDCVNVQALWLAGITAYPGVSQRADNRLEKTGVGGSLDVVPWRYFEDPVPAIRHMRSQGWRVVAVEQGQGSVAWNVAALSTPLIVVLGHEREGVHPDLIGEADVVIELPVRGITNSLNVALCASACLYELLRQWSVRRPDRALT